MIVTSEEADKDRGEDEHDKVDGLEIVGGDATCEDDW